MSFKDLATRAAALLKSKPAEPLKKEPHVKASDPGSKTGQPDPKKR